MKTDITRRGFFELLGASAAAAALDGCCCGADCCCGGIKAKQALQLYSIRTYIGGKKDKAGNVVKPGVGLAQALKDVAAIGYTGVEFAGYYGCDAKTLKAMLADAGLVACGTHVGNTDYGFDTKEWKFNADVLKKTCEFNLGYGNDLIICPGGGTIPPGTKWSTGRGGEVCQPSQAIDDFTKKLADLYNKAAEVAKAEGCRIGLHNHTWEFGIKMLDGTTYWDYFFSNTSKDVCMEQDVGWTTCAGDMFPGLNPTDQYAKYPGRSPTLHAKENGMGKDVKEFDAILGQPGRPGATPVDWDKLIPVTEKDGVKWYVVECERHEEDLSAVTPSYAFLKSKGIS
ncbi:MAG: sugar phosphate isomerase/epimerase [Kiritimatiellae bacterium]|nr:sugar phosphate isomerase/epimerase [Kiritimatiellia bacterium]